MFPGETGDTDNQALVLIVIIIAVVIVIPVVVMLTVEFAGDCGSPNFLSAYSRPEGTRVA